MQRRLQLDTQLPLGDALASAFEAMLIEARTRAEAAIDAPHPSLHNYRRALRRAEALLALAAPFLRGRQRRWLEEAVAHGRRKTRLLRDLDAVSGVIELLEALEALDRDDDQGPDAGGETETAGGTPTEEAVVEVSGAVGASTQTAAPVEVVQTEAPTEVEAPEGDAEAPGSAASRHAGLIALVEAFRGELATSELIAWRLRKNLRSLAGLSSIFKAGLGYVDEASLAASARGSYRAARRLLATARKKGTAEAIHAFRKGARTLRYQLELLASAEGASPETVAASEGVSRIVSMLGDLTDIFALRAIVRTTDRATLGESPKKLVKRLDAIATAKVTEIFELAGSVFAVKPKRFLAGPEGAEVDADTGEPETENAIESEGAPEADEADASAAPSDGPGGAVEGDSAGAPELNSNAEASAMDGDED